MGEFGAENDPRATTEGCGVLGRGATRETTSIVPSNQLLPECILVSILTIRFVPPMAEYSNT